MKNNNPIDVMSCTFVIACRRRVCRAVSNGIAFVECKFWKERNYYCDDRAIGNIKLSIGPKPECTHRTSLTLRIT